MIPDPSQRLRDANDGIVVDNAGSRLGTRLATIAVASALFMEFVDSTALSTALPTLAQVFHTDPSLLKLALTSYILALAVVVPASGWVAGKFGPKIVFLMAEAIFLIGSLLCGCSHSLGELIGFRIIQGIGGGMMTPVGRLIVLGSVPRNDLISAMGWFTAPALIGPLLGPPLSGLVLTIASWPWIFFINVPIGIIGIVSVWRLVPHLKRAQPGRFDINGFILAGLAISTIVAASETDGGSIVPFNLQILLTFVAVISSALCILHALRAKRPVLNFRLLRYRTYCASVTGGIFTRVGIGATPFLLPLLLQVGLGWSPLQSGTITIATAIGALISKPLLPSIIRCLGFRSALIAANLVGAVLTAAPALFRDNTPVILIFVILAVTGFIRSTQFTALNAVAYAELPPELVSDGSTLSVVSQQVGLCLGISLGGIMLHLARGGSTLLRPSEFVIPFIAVGLVTMLGAPIYHVLKQDAGDVMRG